MEELYKQAMKLHAEGLGRVRIGRKLGVSPATVGSWLHQGHQPLKQPNLTPSPELAYVIGARLGDGHVCKRKIRHGIYYSHVTLLEAKDKDFVEVFAQSLEKVSRRKLHVAPASKEKWYVGCYSKSVYEFLKSKKVRDYLDVIKVFPADFIRGFADADGGASICRKQVVVRFTNTNLSLLEFTKELLYSIFNIYSRMFERKKQAPHHKIAYDLIIHRQIDVSRFAISIGFYIERKDEKLLKVFRNSSRMLGRIRLWKRALELRKRGYTVPQIFQKIGVPYSTIAKWIYEGRKPLGWHDDAKKELTR